MKKARNLILFSVLTFLLSIFMGMPVFAKEMDLKTLGDLIVNSNPNAESFYVIGKYAFTMNYVGTNNLNVEDIMISAHSIELSEADGEKIKGTTAYSKMSVYQIVADTDDDDGNVTGWHVSDKNLFGTNKLSNDATFDIDYIDYVKVKNIYTVTFVDENDSEIKKEYVIEGTKITAPETKDKEGYDFKGWYKCNDDACATLDGNEFNFENTEIRENIKLKVKWEIKHLKVTFDSNGGTSVNEANVDYGNTVSKPNDPTQVGYDFKGWYKCNDDTCDTLEEQEFNFNDTQIKENIKLKAKWEQIKYTITFKGVSDNIILEDDNDDILDSSKYEENEYLTGKTAVVTYPYKLKENQIPETDHTADGYNFIGWYLETGEKIDNLTDYAFNEDTTIIGKWEVMKFTVSFDSDGGNTIGDIVVRYKDKVMSPGDAIKNNTNAYNAYEFAGWYKCNNDECTTIEDAKFDFEKTEITENIKLKAKYVNKVYTNKMIANFVSSLKTDDFSAYETEETKKISFAIINKDVLLSKNFDIFINGLEDMVQIKNVANIVITYNENQRIELTSTSNISEEIETFFNNLISKEYASAKLEDLYNKTFSMTINLSGDYTNEQEKNNDSYTVDFITEFAKVKNEQELRDNLTKVKEIIIDTENWDGDITSPIIINNDIAIDFRNANITSNIQNNKYTFIINAGNVVIKDLNLTIDVLKPSEYNRTEQKANIVKNTVGIKVAEGATLTANNFHVKTKDTINYDDLTIASEKLGGSEVTVNENAAIELYGKLSGANIVYDSEIYGSPTVLVKDDKTAAMNVNGFHSNKGLYVVIDSDSHDSFATIKNNFVNYYRNYNYSYLAYAWFKSDYTSIHPAAFIYGENITVPKAFQVGGREHTFSGSNGSTYELVGWRSRSYSGTKSNDDVHKMKITNNETYYFYTDYIIK